MRKARWGLAVLLLAGSAGAAFAQGTRKDDIVFNAQGRPMGGATVRVCTAAATGQPCTPLALIYSDITLTVPLANPLTTDGLGNYTFYAAPGRYMIELSGTGITPKQTPNVLLPADPSGGGGSVNVGVVGDLGSYTGVSTIGDSGVAASSVVSLNNDNKFLNNERIKGPIPWRDITAYGARSVPAGAIPQSTATCTSGSSTVTLGGSPAFVNGDGVVLYGCGATPTMTTPTAPAVQAGNSITLTVPQSQLQTLTGASTYNYKIIAHDQAGGLSLPSSATTLATGAAALGQQTLTVASESLTGNTLTVVTTASHNLLVNTLVHIQNSTNAALSTWANVTSITNATTFVIANMTVAAGNGVTITSTGGTLTYYIGNHLTWAYSAGAWEYYICASRPADAGAYHVIGVSYPYNAAADNNGAGSLVYTDWGSVLSSAPKLPNYINDAACTAGAVTNDYLSTTITSGAGTSTLMLGANASNNSAGKSIYFDDAPAIAAAVAAEVSSGSNSEILFPPTPGFTYFVISSVLNAFSPRIAFHQQGNILVNDTVIGPGKWQGDQSAHFTNNSFSLNGTALVNCVSGWPCIYVSPGNAENYEYFTMNNLQSPSNQSLGLLVDGNAFNGTRVRHMNFSSGDTTDFTGISLLIRPANFLCEYTDLGFNGGPGQGYTDQTWTPVMWVMHGLAETGTTQLYTVGGISGTTRGIYLTSYGHGIVGTVGSVYLQGTIMPAVALQNFNGTAPAGGDFSGIHNDTSPQPNLAILGGPSPIAANISFGGWSGGVESSGTYAPILVGTAPAGLSLGGNNNNTPGPQFGQFPISYFPANTGGFYNYYSNAGEAVLGGKQNTYRYYNPVMSQTGMFVPLATPTILTSSVSAGGTATCCGAQTYSIIAVGPNGGWSAASTVSLTTSAPSRTINLTWTAVPGATGYNVMENGNKCANWSDCSAGPGHQILGTSFTYAGGAGCCYAVAIPDQPGDGIAGFNYANGLFGQKLSITGNSSTSRLLVNKGTAYSGADASLTLSAGWGATATKSAALGYDQALSFTVNSSGAGQAANPTVQITFKDGAWGAAPIYDCIKNDVVAPDPVKLTTAINGAFTILTITFNGTPVAGNSYNLQCVALGN